MIYGSWNCGVKLVVSPSFYFWAPIQSLVARPEPHVRDVPRRKLANQPSYLFLGESASLLGISISTPLRWAIVSYSRFRQNKTETISQDKLDVKVFHLSSPFA